MNKRKCLLCDNEVYPQYEVDVGIGIISSIEPPICEDCYQLKPDEVQKILDKEKQLMESFNFDF
jgi:hypothetical protein